MPTPLKIVVGGYIVGYPLGGMTWHHLNYLLGLTSLGHEVWFLEDSGSWLAPFDPSTNTTSPDPAYGLNYLRETFAAVGLPPRFCYYSEFWDTHYGLQKDELHQLLASADLLLCVSGVTPLRDGRPRPRRTCVIDTDPVFTQLRMTDDAAFIDYYRSFDAVATFGRLIGTPNCPLPTHGFDWIGTAQPVALEHWPVTRCDSRVFGTIGKWEHASDRTMAFNGQTYQSSKGVEWEKLIDLPTRLAAGESRVTAGRTTEGGVGENRAAEDAVARERAANDGVATAGASAGSNAAKAGAAEESEAAAANAVGDGAVADGAVVDGAVVDGAVGAGAVGAGAGGVGATLRIAMAGLPEATRKRYQRAGWAFEDATAASISPAAFGNYVRSLAGELTVAKQIYAGLPSGWFSDRSAAFLASGRPVVTQSSGFEQWLPTGEGVFAFETLSEAAAALGAITADYARHARTARQIAEQHFDAKRVLGELLATVM